MRLNEFLRVMGLLTFTFSILVAGSSVPIMSTCSILEKGELLPRQLPCSVKIYANTSEVEVTIKLLEDGRTFVYSDGYNQAELLNGYAAEAKEEMFNMLCFEQIHKVEIQKVCYERLQEME